MRKVILFIVAFVLSMGTCSQAAGKKTAGNAGVPFETKRSTFFDNGNLDEYTASSWDASYAHVIAEERFSASGGMIEQVEFAYDDGKGLITAKITRDVESRIKSRVAYQHNPQGLLWRENFVDKNGKIVSTLEYAYDNNGNRSSKIIKNRGGDKLAETTYTYDASQKMITSVTRDYAENAISSTKYSYDSQGNCIKEEVVNNEGKVTSITTYVWQEGNEVKNELASADGKVQLRISTEYGENGELTKKTVENFQGQSKQVMQYEYIFRPAKKQG